MGDSVFTMRLADAAIRVEALHASLRRMCSGYLVPDGIVPDVTVRMSQTDIDRERDLATSDEDWSDSYLEALAVYRKIATWAPLHRRLLVHGAVVEHASRAYMFCAASGTGKSTHIRLWRRYLGDAVSIVNGDKPLVLVPEAAGADGTGVPAGAESSAVAYGTPWCGKEGWQRNTSAPLAGICLLHRTPEPGANAIRRIEPVQALDFMMHQVYLSDTADAAGATLDLLDALLTRTPLFELFCDMSEDAVRTSFEGLTGEHYVSINA